MTDKQKFNFDKVISTIPIHELLPIIKPDPPPEIMKALSKLKYNSIHITFFNLCSLKELMLVLNHH